MPSHAPWVLCVTGAESTGKTTLARQLSDWLSVPLVPEVARQYLTPGRPYRADDVLAIAAAQQAAERRALAAGRALVVADTDLTVIQVWWEEKYGPLHPRIAEGLAARGPRRYLLPAPDLPWEPDPLRESPRDRPRLHARYRQLLDDGPFEWAEVVGEGIARFDSARRHVARWRADDPPTDATAR